MALGTRRTPERNSPLFSGVTLQKRLGTTVVLTGAATMTTDQLLAGLLPVDCQDATTWTTPTATALNAAISGVEVGTSFDLDIINYGDTTLTLAGGTGVTTPTIATVEGVLTIATLNSKRFTFCCTGVANPSDPSTSDSWKVFAYGSIAAAVA